MDSSIKRNTIIIFMLLIMVILAIVLIADSKTHENKSKEASNRETETQSNTETGFKNGDTMPEEELKLFLKDDTFFDKEDSYQNLKRAGTEVTLLVSSVEQDLRIKVVNHEGRPIIGIPFGVTLNNGGKYKDEDEDGMIHIENLVGGEYYVSLDSIEGYKIPNNKVKVDVKDQVEYMAIQDISYFIKSEDEINAILDDTSEKNAEIEAEDSENTLSRLSDGNHYFGIDVSKWNQKIDWVAVKNSGVDFAIIRCGYRGSSTGSLVEDPYFKANIEGATEVGIKVGLYFFTQATTEVEAVEEASMAISLAQEYQLDYPIFIDTESAGGNGRADGLDVDTRTNICKAFAETITSGGYQAGIYASKNWYENKVNPEALSDYVIWLAQYADAPTYTGEYHLWQYTSRGSIDGINGNVDLNLSYLGENN